MKENFENIEVIPNSDHIFGLFQDNPEEECEKNMENKDKEKEGPEID